MNLRIAERLRASNYFVDTLEPIDNDRWQKNVMVEGRKIQNDKNDDDSKILLRIDLL